MVDQAPRGIAYGSGKPVKATIWNEDKSPPAKVVDCLFNPTEYTFSKRNVWGDGPAAGGEMPMASFVSGGAMTLDLELLFDTLTLAPDGGDTGPPHDVREYTDKVLDLMRVDPSTVDNNKQTPGRPPRVSFRWGRFWSNRSVLTSVSQRFTLFWEDGRPIRASLSVSFQQVDSGTSYPPQNPTSQGHAQRLRLVGPGETIDSIAFGEFGDVSKWRLIADYNRLADPLHLRVGQRLAIPTSGRIE
jgi:hypothetical protein